MRDNTTHYRTIWLSDIHLGSRGCQADALLEFLRAHSSEHLYLVGDIVDFWSLSRKVYFPQSHVNVMRKFLSRSNQGTHVVYVPGNHDETVRAFIPMVLGNIEVVEQIIHETVDGKRLLVIHGDAFDQVVKHTRWLAWVGDVGYALLLRSNHVINALRRGLNLPYWSLSAYVKSSVKQAVNFISGYERAVSGAARAMSVDGVVCGHIHHAEMRSMDGILYCNTGDWVESCTALVEHMDGRLEIIDWSTNPTSAITENAPCPAAS